MADTLLAVDGNNILTRAVKATERVSLEADGMSTAPILVFINMLSKYVKLVHPDRVVVCFDGGRSDHRLAIYADYKATRRISESRLDRSWFAVVRTFLFLAGVPQTELSHVEADDIIAHYWRQHRYRMTILSGDKDFLQLLDDDTVQIRPGDGDEQWTAERVTQEMGCRPEHLPSVMALTGDAIDGIPGVPRYGTITACKVLARYDWDLDAALKGPTLDGLGPMVRRNLALVDLRSSPENFPVEDPPPFSPTPPDSWLWTNLMEWCDRYAMSSVRDRLTDKSLWTPRLGRRGQQVMFT